MQIEQYNFFKKLFFDLYSKLDDNEYKNILVISDNDFYSINFNNSLLSEIKQKYKILCLYFHEEFDYNYKIKTLIQKCIDLKLNLYIFTKNPSGNLFLNSKYKNFSNIFFNEFDKSFITNLNLNKLYDASDKNIKLLFLYYNRKPNRDYVICKLFKENELYQKNNYISFHNYIPVRYDLRYLGSDDYETHYKSYAIENDIDFDFLRDLKLIPKEINVHNQVETQSDSFYLYSKSKFNIICEPLFGYGNDVNDYSYYDDLLTNKTILPILYKNVFFLHGHNNNFSNELKKIGIRMFFDNIDDFLKNMNDEYYYSNDVQETLEHNQKVLLNLLKNSKQNLYNDFKKILNEI